MKPLGVIPFSSAIPSQYFLSESGSFTDTASVFLASISGRSLDLVSNFFVQPNQCVTKNPVRTLAMPKVEPRDVALPCPTLVSDLRLRQSGVHDFLNNSFPVHAAHFKRRCVYIASATAFVLMISRKLSALALDTYECTCDYLSNAAKHRCLLFHKSDLRHERRTNRQSTGKRRADHSAISDGRPINA